MMQIYGVIELTIVHGSFFCGKNVALLSPIG